MAAFDTPRAQTFGATARIVNFFGAAVQAFETWRDHRATVRALSGLSAHELEDIGLTRADIDAIGR